MVKLAVFLENWPCKTRLHGSLAKPLIQDNMPPLHFFLRTPMTARLYNILRREWSQLRLSPGNINNSYDDDDVDDKVK